MQVERKKIRNILHLLTKCAMLQNFRQQQTIKLKVVRDEEVTNNKKRIVFAMCEDIFAIKDLTKDQRDVLSQISFFCQKNGACTASNEYFTRFFELSKRTIQVILSNLKDKGFINVYLKKGVEIYGTDRTIKVNYDKIEKAEKRDLSFFKYFQNSEVQDFNLEDQNHVQNQTKPRAEFAPGTDNKETTCRIKQNHVQNQTKPRAEFAPNNTKENNFENTEEYHAHTHQKNESSDDNYFNMNFSTNNKVEEKTPDIQNQVTQENTEVAPKTNNLVEAKQSKNPHYDIQELLNNSFIIVSEREFTENHFFDDSPFFHFEIFERSFKSAYPKFAEKYDLAYYHERIKNWRKSKAKKYQAVWWLTLAKNWMERDKTPTLKTEILQIENPFKTEACKKLWDEWVQKKGFSSKSAAEKTIEILLKYPEDFVVTQIQSGLCSNWKTLAGNITLMQKSFLIWQENTSKNPKTVQIPMTSETEKLSDTQKVAYQEIQKVIGQLLSSHFSTQDNQRYDVIISTSKSMKALLAKIVELGKKAKAHDLKDQRTYLLNMHEYVKYEIEQVEKQELEAEEKKNKSQELASPNIEELKEPQTEEVKNFENVETEVLSSQEPMIEQIVKTETEEPKISLNQELEAQESKETTVLKTENTEVQESEELNDKKAIQRAKLKEIADREAERKRKIAEAKKNNYKNKQDKTEEPETQVTEEISDDELMRQMLLVNFRIPQSRLSEFVDYYQNDKAKFYEEQKNLNHIPIEN